MKTKHRCNIHTNISEQNCQIYFSKKLSQFCFPQCKM